MELRKHLDPKVVFIGFYLLVFALYIIYSVLPADATRLYDVTDKVTIPSIGLVSDVTQLSLEDGKLITPDTIVGSYTRSDNKTLLIGHSSTVFKDLDKLKVGAEIFYAHKYYVVQGIDYVAKSSVNMGRLLSAEDTDTLVVMTCAGEMLENGDATHRLIITAVLQSL